MVNRDIILRTPEPEDVDIIYKWENNPEIWLVSNTIVPYSKYDIKKHIIETSRNIYETSQARFIICLLKSMTPIGTIDLFDFDAYHMRAGVGILIAEKEYRRNGYAKMALDALIEYSFNHLRLHQLYCSISADNKTSLALFEKSGFRKTGVRTDWIKAREGYYDEIFMQLISPSGGN